eukprot:15469985-Alexandrium_andersonii.AAC.1
MALGRETLVTRNALSRGCRARGTLPAESAWALRTGTALDTQHAGPGYRDTAETPGSRVVPQHVQTRPAAHWAGQACQ